MPAHQPYIYMHRARFLSHLQQYSTSRLGENADAALFIYVNYCPTKGSLCMMSSRPICRQPCVLHFSVIVVVVVVEHGESADDERNRTSCTDFSYQHAVLVHNSGRDLNTHATMVSCHFTFTLPSLSPLRVYLSITVPSWSVISIYCTVARPDSFFPEGRAGGRAENLTTQSRATVL
jgi:hypothetical protein